MYGALRALETLAQSVHVVSLERVFDGDSLSPRPTMNFDGDFSPGSVLVLNALGLAGRVLVVGMWAGVGAGFKPPKFLQPGDVVRVFIDGVGELENVVGE